MRDRVLVFDIDGVLCDFTSGFTARAAKLGLIEHSWSARVQPRFHFDFHVAPVWDSITDDPRWWRSLSSLVTNHDMRALDRWVEAHGSIVYMTARRETGNVGGQTVGWLDDQRFPPGPVFLIGEKDSLVIALRHQLAGVIDDRPDTLERLVSYAYHLPVYARAWPYNEHISKEIPRVGSIAQFVAKAEKRSRVDDE